MVLPVSISTSYYAKAVRDRAEAKPLVWARNKLADLRLLLLQEAGRLESGHHN
ncbi:hypothetical protein YWIDRAFT_03953 [Streptomyces sp. SceaMP-e96]|jgi:hypothetical protein|nr:hypothetical protein YWIDRAFT_03953 [Streptomyces sp. SceaMP-e96]